MGRFWFENVWSGPIDPSCVIHGCCPGSLCGVCKSCRCAYVLLLHIAANLQGLTRIRRLILLPCIGRIATEADLPYLALGEDDSSRPCSLFELMQSSVCMPRVLRREAVRRRVCPVSPLPASSSSRDRHSPASAPSEPVRLSWHTLA